MASITKQQIKKILKDVRDELEEAIADKGEEQNNAGQPIDVDIKIEVGAEPPPSPMYLASEEPTAFTECFWFCYTIGGVRTCKLYCY